VTSPAVGANGAPDLPEYAPVPAIAKGAVLNEHGYHVWQVERNLYAVTDNVYMSAFLTTPDGVVIFDAPPNIGHNIRRAVDEVTAANGLTNQVTHMVYSHHHADHQGASSLFGGDIVRIGHEETRRLLLRDDDPARPVPDVTFSDRYTLEVGGERVELAWHGPNHSPDNIYIHFPGHDTLIFIDVVNAGWIPIYNLNLSDSTTSTSATTSSATPAPRPSHWSTRGRTSSAGTWAGWRPARTSRCTSSTSPTSKPDRARRWPRSTPDRFSSTTERTCGPRSAPTSMAGANGRRPVAVAVLHLPARHG
jgi:glyoxylase-like metal-dependent hydrolase (beta-lactamase superfamily II)